MCDFFDDFGIEGWMIFGSANEELAEEEQNELEQDFEDNEYDVDQSDDYS